MYDNESNYDTIYHHYYDPKGPYHPGITVNAGSRPSF